MPSDNIRVDLQDALAVPWSKRPSAAVWESPLLGGTGRNPLGDRDRSSLVLVDTRTQLREFLASRRARVTPEQAGLPAYGGHRRVPGLRREEVALLAGVSVEYYTRLERGNAHGVSDTMCWRRSPGRSS